MNSKKIFDFLKKFLSSFTIVLVLWVLLALMFVSFLTISEYKPEDIVELEPSGEASGTLKLNEEIDLVSWNIGYAALGDNADFFMEGGKGVRTATQTRLSDNIGNIFSWLNEKDPDILLLQEVDAGSDRSYKLNETEYFTRLKGRESVFAPNHICLYIPYPLPPIGTVLSGLQTLSVFDISEAQRIQLPNFFSWPVRVAQMKRCLAVTRMPVEGSDRELVVINLHLEAYDSNGEDKAAQTAALRKVLEEETAKGNYVIAGGDFNQIFSNMGDLYPVKEGLWAPGRLDVGEFPSEFSFYMDPELPSCRALNEPYAEADKAAFQYYLIDGFIVSPNIEVLEMKNADLDFVSSDHNPAMLKFVLK